MDDLQIFSNEKFGELEVIAVDSKVYFAATESAKMLKYADLYKALKQHCRKDGPNAAKKLYFRGQSFEIDYTFKDAGCGGIRKLDICWSHSNCLTPWCIHDTTKNRRNTN